MALALNTGHPLYSDLVALIGVDDDNSIKDLKGDTCTPNAAVVIGSGTYGRHFRTTNSSNNSLGVALTNGFQTKPIANPVGTTFVVINAGNGWASRGSVFPTVIDNVNSPRVTTGDVVAAFQNDGTSAVGAINVVGTGAHSFGIAYTSTTSHKAFTDGGNVVNSATNLGNASDAYKVKYLGGHLSGGYGYFNADYVWIAHFRRFLSDAEIADLHTSLGASNAFGLVVSGGTNATANGGTGTSSGSGSGGTATGVTAGAGSAAGGLGTSSGSGTGGTAAGGISGSGTITIPAIKDLTTGALRANESVITVIVSDQTTGALVVKKTAQVTDGAGNCTVSDAAITSGVTYRVTTIHSDGSEGTWKYLAA